MKTSKKIKINWKPPEAMDKEPLHKKSHQSQAELLQDKINAELNEMSTMKTEWYVER